jgi:hypothetical protein
MGLITLVAPLVPQHSTWLWLGIMNSEWRIAHRAHNVKYLHCLSSVTS